MKILLVEDQAKLRAFAKKGLEELGISVEAVGDGDEAFRCAPPHRGPPPRRRARAPAARRGSRDGFARAKSHAREGEEIVFTTREFELLEFLMRSPGRVFGRVQIYEHVWGYDMDLESNLVEVYMQRLRAKIDKDREPKLLRTVRNAGYVLDGK